MTNVISLDFDFWLEMPKFESFDWGFREATFFLEHIWAIRASSALAAGKDLREICKIAADEPHPTSFVNLLKNHRIKVAKGQVAISESHAVAYKWLVRLKDLHIIHIDAHHDLGYGGHYGLLDCGSWLRHLINKGKVSKLTIIYPKWRKRQVNEWENCGREAKKGLDIPIKVRYGLAENLPTDIQVRKLFVARSGAWVPPWLDRDFRDLVFELWRAHGNMMMYGWKQFEDIERNLDWPGIKKMAAQTKKFVEEVRVRHKNIGLAG